MGPKTCDLCSEPHTIVGIQTAVTLWLDRPGRCERCLFDRSPDNRNRDTPDTQIHELLPRLRPLSVGDV
jgi:hypothetical protein